MLLCLFLKKILVVKYMFRGICTCICVCSRFCGMMRVNLSATDQIGTPKVREWTLPIFECSHRETILSMNE